MGSHAYITIVNKTGSAMKLVHCHSYQMNEWNFPKKVGAGESERFEVEWCATLFKHQKDDAGEAYYELENHSSKRIEFAMWNGKEYNFTVKQIGFKDIDSNAKNVDWVNKGEIVFVFYEKGVNFKQWMKQIDGNTPINKLCIPGTHDTLTYSVGGVLENTAKTQKENFVEQLNCGCRYFDLRGDKNLSGCHGIVKCDDNWRDVMGWVKEFFAANPDETLVMRMKYDGGADNSDYKKNIEKFFDDYRSLFWRNNLSRGFPILNDVRGKIVVLDSLDGHYISGRGYGYMYSQEGKFDIQDDYNGPDEDEKFDKIKDNIELPYNPERMKINHVSATGKTGGIVVGWDPRDYANYENPRVIEYLAGRTERPVTGLLIFDFINSFITPTVIKWNDLRDLG